MKASDKIFFISIAPLTKVFVTIKTITISLLFMGKVAK
jgi:hypothetical protein